MAIDMPNFSSRAKRLVAKCQRRQCRLARQSSASAGTLGPRDGGVEVLPEDWSRQLEGSHCDLETRKSTSGGIIMLEEHCLKTWSTNQSSPALRSCEAEHCAVVDGASRALGMQTAAKELGISVEDLSVQMATDSSGAKSFALRRSGRISHIEVKWLWLQAAADGKFPFDEGGRLTESGGHSDEAQGLARRRGTAEEGQCARDGTRQ